MTLKKSFIIHGYKQKNTSISAGVLDIFILKKSLICCNAVTSVY
ncbi:hypothetical protein SAMN05444388_104163 [Flavobacterium johnsoniae]|uniref:Uncharacterized protein n=1 Tax=Flavobacterium johnsoniae TaxID=986 RepID=A0A1M5MFX9_FLAJO|nr:hypothetical protein SAMN05444388_104163 [Flavobacterium johnsoniae]